MARETKVLKFGGTSMGSEKALGQVIHVIKHSQKSGRVAAVVVSAMSGTTDQLLEVARLAAKKDPLYAKRLAAIERRHLEIIDTLVSKENRAHSRLEITKLLGHLNEAVHGIRLVRDSSLQARDYMVSYGERLSAHLLTEILKDHGIPCEYLDARKVVLTDANFGEAHVDFRATNRAIKVHFHRHKQLQIVTGFIGATSDKKTTTLGRGGSDYSAAIFGAALGANAIEIWTDVSGIYSANPRLVKSARVIPELAFEEAGELAYFGAKVLHPKTILPAMREKIPVRVLNTFKPSDMGTTIVSGFAERRKKSHTVEALTFKRPVTVVHLQSPEFFDENGLMARIFEIFDEERTSVDVVATSVAGVTLTIDDTENLKSIMKKLEKYGTVRVESGKAILCAVGGAVNAAGIAGKMFTVLGKHNIAVELISQAASGVSTTFVVNEKDAEKALKVLHKTYIR